MDQELYELAKKAGEFLKSSNLVLVTAESCTGGLLAGSITDVAGSSAYFDRGFIVYTNDAKHELLEVQNDTLEKFGAVSEGVAIEMALGALKHSHAQLAIAITGIAGPNSDGSDKPVGMVCFAVASLDKEPRSVTKYFDGDRFSVKKEAVRFGLNEIITYSSDK